MLANLLKPKVDLTALILRLGLASIFIVHGYFKVVQTYPLIKEMSLQIQQVVGWTELVSGVMLAVGFLSRLAALASIPIQVGAIVLVTGKRAMTVLSFEATGADYTKVGPEYNGIIIVAALAVVLLGSGCVSVDHCLRAMFRDKKSEATREAAREPAAAAPV
jgi:uncharacterized membrane protein YphA (DoxX/SURF4 family)